MGDGDLRVHLPVISPPARRGDCADIPRPCTRFACRHNLALENWKGERRFASEHSCTLDMIEANAGESTLVEVGEVFELSRERIRQLEPAALRRWWIILAESPRGDQMIEDLGDLLGVDPWEELVRACQEELGKAKPRTSTGRSRRPWSDVEEDTLKSMWLDGYQDDTVAARLKRTVGAVETRRAQLGLVGERKPGDPRLANACR